MAAARNTYEAEPCISAKPNTIKILKDVPLYGSTKMTCKFQAGHIARIDFSCRDWRKVVHHASRFGGAL